ncbi:hypothetical protein [Halobaculum sp. EA56]|uniref:hypothetical protein n=1 Tax=Halobaculum sp. EA56 TaxID=3421648 RepID=UPI003EB71FEF
MKVFVWWALSPFLLDPAIRAFEVITVRAGTRIVDLIGGEHPNVPSGDVAPAVLALGHTLTLAVDIKIVSARGKHRPFSR